MSARLSHSENRLRWSVEGDVTAFGASRGFESNGRIATQSQPRIKPGARLVREWHERTYSVIATEEGFQFEGKVYRSLTGIAREITGAGWSGPRFFGLAKAVNASEGVDAPLREVDIDDWAGGDPSQCVVASDA